MDVVFTHFDSPLLPPRQLEILRLARRGKSFTEITTLLDISANTLRWYVSQIRRVLPAFDTVDAEQTTDRLTAREQEVALLVAQGLSTNAISKRLIVSPHTVSTHIKQIYRKTGATNRVQLAKITGDIAMSSTSHLAHAEG